MPQRQKQDLKQNLIVLGIVVEKHRNKGIIVSEVKFNNMRNEQSTLTIGLYKDYYTKESWFHLFQNYNIYNVGLTKDNSLVALKQDTISQIPHVELNGLTEMELKVAIRNNPNLYPSIEDYRLKLMGTSREEQILNSQIEQSKQSYLEHKKATGLQITKEELLSQRNTLALMDYIKNIKGGTDEDYQYYKDYYYDLKDRDLYDRFMQGGVTRAEIMSHFSARSDLGGEKLKMQLLEMCDQQDDMRAIRQNGGRISITRG